MASYTDAITKFNPYVEQLPVDAMAQVGMYKQGKYDEGVQKIQGYIDNIAGLDVVKPLHKQYLQSKLNELGSNLRKVAGGDFSNFQLVNSVGGMATQIVKDPTIQNAVYSTKVVRKGQAAMEAAKKEGKSSVENEWWWNSQVNDWMGDNDAKTKFGGEYNQYVDMDKKLREVADKVHEYDNSIDVPYVRDNKGNTIYYKTEEVVDKATGKKTQQTTASIDPNSGGTAKIDDAMLRVITKGKSAEKILANFYDSLGENDKRQLMITGNYHYKDATKETFKNDITNAFSDEKKILNERVVNLATSLTTDPKLTGDQKAAIEAKIKTINTKLNDGSLDVEMQKKIANIDSIPDMKAYKYQLYTQKYLTRLANDMSYESLKTQYESNPYAQMDMEKKKLQVQVDHNNQLNRQWQLDYNFKVQDAADKSAWEKYKFEKEHPELFSNPYVVDSGALPTDQDKDNLDVLDTRIKSRDGDVKTLDSSFNGAEVPDWNGMTSDAKKAYLDSQYSMYEKSPGAFLKSVNNNNLRDYLTSRYEIEQAKVRDQNLYNKVFNESKAKFEDELDKKLNNIGGLKVGNKVFTPTQVIQFHKDFVSAAEAADPTTVQQLAAAMPNDQRTLFMSLYRVKHGQGTAADKASFNRMQTLITTSNAEHENMIKNKKKWEADRLNELDPQSQTQIGTLNYSGNKQMKLQVDRFVGNEMTRLKQVGKDVTDITTAMSGTDAKYVVEKKSDGSATMHITSEKGSADVEMTAGQLGSHFSDIAVTSPFNQWKGYINSSPGQTRTTNAMGAGTPAAATAAAIGGWTLPLLKNSGYENLVRIDIEGNNSNTGKKSDMYQLRMYVYDTKSGNWKTDIITRKGFKNEAEIQQDLQGIGPATIKEFLKITP